jgi:hypothetical protein
MTYDYDFDYYSGRDLEYPVRITKPRLSANPTPAEARKYADDLEAYDPKNKDYHRLVSEYNNAIRDRQDKLKTKLCEDYGITKKQCEVLWSAAWERGHSSGLSDVIHYFDLYHDIAMAFAKG